MRKRQYTNRIIIHHSASPGDTTVDQIRDWHVNGNKWADIGYHFILQSSSNNVYPGRDQWRTGAHTKGQNADSIGICVTGNFENAALPKPVGDTLISLLKKLFDEYNLTWDNVYYHKSFGNTSCPGKYLAQFIDEAKIKKR